MSKSKKIDGKQIGMLIFLILVVIGFTAPIFINNLEPETNQYIEPRPCMTDTDCSLICEDEPIAIFCSNNLCTQNACNERNFYPYNQTFTSFSLEIKLNNTLIDLSKLTNNQNFFVIFEKAQVKTFSPLINLVQILEKINIKLDPQCLTINNTAHCTIDEHQLQLNINNNQSYQFDYIPQNNDKIKIIYS